MRTRRDSAGQQHADASALRKHPAVAAYAVPPEGRIDTGKGAETARELREPLADALHGDPMEVAEMLRYTVGELGELITAAAMRVSDATAFSLWREGVEKPSRLQERKLRILYDATKRMSSVYDQDTTRRFFRIPNSDLGGRSPIAVLEEDTDIITARSVVMNAVDAFLS